MDNLKEALEYLVGLVPPTVQEIELRDGSKDKFSDKPLYRYNPHLPKADALKTSTLTSLIDYIKANIDTMSDKMVVSILSPTHVELLSSLDSERDRETLMVVKADLPAFSFDSYLDKEKFIIGLQSKFVDDPETDKALILKFAGTVESGTVAEYGDDGVTQKATVKTGIATKSDALVPNPVTLKPFRTFLEVSQPQSAFIFRMKQNKYDGVECGIFEADGGAWKLDAMQTIKNYLKEELKEFPQFTVIS